MMTAHIICGSVGAGKTTYSLRLAEETGALRFTIDEWMEMLFLMDAPDPISYQWALARVERCERKMLALCGQLRGKGLDIILDLGFFKREQRERVRRALTGLEMDKRLYYLDVSAAVRWERVSQRNAEKGDTYSHEVTRGMFDFCEDLFEVPDETGLEGAVIVA